MGLHRPKGLTPTSYSKSMGGGSLSPHRPPAGIDIKTPIFMKDDDDDDDDGENNVDGNSMTSAIVAATAITPKNMSKLIVLVLYRFWGFYPVLSRGLGGG